MVPCFDLISEVRHGRGTRNGGRLTIGCGRVSSSKAGFSKYNRKDEHGRSIWKPLRNSITRVEAQLSCIGRRDRGIWILFGSRRRRGTFGRSKGNGGQ